MADKQAGGPVTGAGQATIGGSRKLTEGEVGFRKDHGISNLRCGDCAFFTAGDCQIVGSSVGNNDICDQFEPDTRGNVSADMATEERRTQPLSTLEMWITRVSRDKKTGVRRWYATSSGVKKDLYNEQMSTALFDDFVRRIDEKEIAPAPFISEAWQGGLPYLGIAHYLDLNGFGIVGPTEAVWRDGEVLKMKGTFYNTPLADAAFDAIQKDRLEKRTDNERVRVSIAFIDWGHNHGKKRIFERKSLADECMLCQAGVSDKIYTSGHLVHQALTRRPAYIETEISVSLEERTMSKSKRQDDAASIVGDELADELEKRTNKELVGRADDGAGKVAAGAIVIKDESGGQEESSESAEVERTFGGARTLDDAEAFLTESANEPVLLDSWMILATVLGNIAGDESREAVYEVVRDFQNTLDVKTAEAVVQVSRALGDAPMSKEKTKKAVVKRQVPPQFRKDEEEEKRKRRPEEEEVEDEVVEEEEEEESEEEEEGKKKKNPFAEKSEPDALDVAYATMREAYDEALATPGDSAMRLSMINESFQSFGAEIQAQVEAATASAPVSQAAITRAVSEAVAPLAAAVTALQAQIQAGVGTTPTVINNSIPRRRAIKMPTSVTPSLPVVRSEPQGPSEENPTPNLRAIIRRSTIGFERARGG